MQSVAIGFTGDFCPMGRIQEGYINGVWQPYFEGVKPFFDQNQINILDLECPLTTTESQITKTGPHLKCLPGTADMLPYLNCTSVATANNHFKDYDVAGMIDTYAALQQRGIKWFGSGLNKDAASEPYYTEENGLQFCFLNMAENEWTTTHDQSPGCNPIDFPPALRKIQEARANGVDFIVVIIHGGHEHYALPSPRMKAQARFMIDAGADAVVSHHTHIISGHENYQNKPIFYGLGNFCFDWPGKQYSPWNYGMLLQLKFSKNQPIEATYKFVEQNNANPGVRFVNAADETKLNAELQRLNSIIQDDVLLKVQFENYASTQQKIMEARIQPYQGRFLGALLSRGLLPKLMGRNKKKMLQILTQCESHREVLLHCLKQVK
jgi:poly-gamma-glutamate capsule biosynthesis protein CapA/YwtB (metallophosphatase superfamily)